MPITNPEKRRAYYRAYMKRYEAERHETIGRQRRDRRQANLALEREKATERNRAKGHAPRPEGGRHSQTRINVNTGRRWVIFEDRVYCNSRIGFTSQDLREMQLALQGHVEELHRMTLEKMEADRREEEEAARKEREAAAKKAQKKAKAPAKKTKRR